MIAAPLPQVRVLVCKRDVALASQCLGSLLRYSADPIELILHDDGSIGSDEKARLEAALPGASIISKTEANDVVLPALKDFPRLRAFRERNPTGQKLVDVGLLAGSDIIQCDSDVLFLRPFRGLFRWPGHDIDCVHLLDIADAFCLKPWQLGDLRLLHRFNSGLMMIRRQCFDIARMEALVRFIEDSPGYRDNKGYQWFLEQTCWSAVAGTRPAAAWSSNQLRVISKTDRYAPDLVAGHFVGSVRHLLVRFEQRSRDAQVANLPPVEIATRTARPYATSSYLTDRLANRFKNVAGLVSGQLLKA